MSVVAGWCNAVPGTLLAVATSHPKRINKTLARQNDIFVEIFLTKTKKKKKE